MEEPAEVPGSILPTQSISSDSVTEYPLNPNPFLIDNIVQKILPNLPLDSLLSCQNVCQFWKQESVNMLERKCATANLTFSSACKSFSSKCFLTFNSENSVENMYPLSMFPKVASWIVDLSMNFDGSEESFERSSFRPITFPRMERLTLNYRKLTGRPKIAAEIMTKVLEKCPVNLREVAVNCNHNWPFALCNLLEPIANSPCLQINSLSISGQVGEEVFNMITNSPFKLHTLKLCFDGPYKLRKVSDGTALQILLLSQAATLENFAICSKYDEEGYGGIRITSFKMPVMPKLESLAIFHHSDLNAFNTHAMQPRENNFLMEDLCYCDQLPALKRLYAPGDLPELYGLLRPCNSLEELVLPHEYWRQNVLPQLASHFPNVQKLQVGHAFLKLASRAWPHLKELTLTVLEETMDVNLEILPLSPREYENLRWRWEQNVPFGQIRTAYQKYKKCGGFSQFCGLRYLKIMFKNTCKPVVLNDLTCLLILLEIPTLETLDVGGHVSAK